MSAGRIVLSCIVVALWLAAWVALALADAGAPASACQALAAGCIVGGALVVAALVRRAR